MANKKQPKQTKSRELEMTSHRHIAGRQDNLSCIAEADRGHRPMPGGFCETKIIKSQHCEGQKPLKGAMLLSIVWCFFVSLNQTHVGFNMTGWIRHWLRDYEFRGPTLTRI